MEFTKLRLLGFKSFVEPTEFAIERGLTGVVGPNGCGKSNLVEALRWVMGESSYKNMRASAMDDVIFSGSGNRPSRNMAEVALFLENEDRTAPASFNDVDELQVSRRIEREAGSVYRINGRDVRAKDVQLLFADVSTGARSPSMIGQGRIGDLIAAKPTARRALLEEAAGISGLHSRRHEAELRLRAAEQNLERLDDVVAQLESQLESLKRQARQATRYRGLAGEIRRHEAAILHLRWHAAREVAAAADEALGTATVKVGEAALIQTEAARGQAVLAHELPALRDGEAKAAAALQRVTIARNQLDDEARRIERRRRDLADRAGQLGQDIAREERMVAENSDIIGHLEREREQLSSETEGREAREAQLGRVLTQAQAKLARDEERLAEATRAFAAAEAQAREAKRRHSDAVQRRDRLDAQLASVRTDLDDVRARIDATSDVGAQARSVSMLEGGLEEAATAARAAENALEDARKAERERRAPLADARQRLAQVETEARTLAKVLNAKGGDLFAPVLDDIRAEKGFEAALGAALGEDLDAPVDEAAPVRWAGSDGSADPALPQGAVPLLDHVRAPVELTRRLAQVGVVAAHDLDRLSVRLVPGQRLVTRDGAVRRWDGFAIAADAPTAAAVKLEQRNRLAELDAEVVEATRALRSVESDHEAAARAVSEAERGGASARDVLSKARQALDAGRRALAEAERAVADLASRRAALEEGASRVEASLVEAREEVAGAASHVAALPDAAALRAQAERAQADTQLSRADTSKARAEYDGLARETAMRADRLGAIERERVQWNQRVIAADRQIETLRQRLAGTQRQLAEVEAAPEGLEAKRRTLTHEIEKAEAARSQAADALAAKENALRDADRKASQALDALSEARQQAARAEERVGAARERRVDAEARIREELQVQPHEALALTGFETTQKMPDPQVLEAKLERLRAERERLGAVNLRADEEAREVGEKRDDLVRERDDLIEAIRQLRNGIQSLNREGRERLLEAFDRVNEQFQSLFTHLFGGGTAELQLVESDDPLEAGLEILARPPGKKPQTMTLLSGGEQALTAMALIFAVFLTNPAPICVLDEVDAPLDDHNVERFCNLMDEMAKNTDTRFVIITHNPITMARMDRLFGVTMAERGVSQLVSVDLQTAESYREAG